MTYDESQPNSLKKSIDILSVLIPVYNEAPTLSTSLRKLYKTLETLHCKFEVIIVESNSTDGSRDILQKLSENLDFRLIYQESPKGKGHAIREAMNYMNGDVFLIFDADLEYNASDIPSLLKPIELGLSAFVLGSRHKDGKALRIMKDVPIRAKVMNVAHKVFVSLLNFSLGTKMSDPFTMYKVFRREVFDGVKLTSNRFDFDWEIVIKAIRRGVAPIEIPIQYTSRSFAEGKKVRFLFDPITWIIALVKFRFIDRNPKNPRET